MTINTYSSLVFSLSGEIDVQTFKDGAWARLARPSIGLNWSVINKPSSILDTNIKILEKGASESEFCSRPRYTWRLSSLSAEAGELRALGRLGLVMTTQKQLTW